MKRGLILSVIALLSICIVEAAPADDEKQAAFQLSFVPPLSTNGWDARNYTNKVSLNLLTGVSRNETGFALGSIANVILNEAHGFQMAGIANYAGGDASGFMLAGIMNSARNYSGFQMAGIVNIARNVRGTQFGVINIAESNDYPIGLVNIIKNGEMSVGVTYNEIGSTMLSFRSGGRILYGIIGIGLNHKTPKSKLVWEGGLGAHIPIIDKFRINNEIKTSSGTNSSKNQFYHHSLAIMPAFRILPQLEIFAGPTLNFMHAESDAQKDLFPSHNLWKKYDANGMKQLYIGYTVGMHFIF